MTKSSFVTGALVAVLVGATVGVATYLKPVDENVEQRELASTGDYDPSAWFQWLEAAGKVSLEQAVEALPEAMRSNYVLMHDSRSVQASSKENPRVIFFDDTARLVVTMTAAEMDGGDRLEVMHFKDGRYEFREITFAPERKPAVSPADPMACKRCHTSGLAPNWRKYRVWSGAYGEVGDELNGELNAFRAFQDRSAAHPRYRLLVKPPNEPLWPFEATADREQRDNRVYRYAPNRRLGIWLNARHGVALASRIRQSPFYRTAPNSVLYLLADCYITRTTEEPVQKLLTTLHEHYLQRYGRSAAVEEWEGNPTDENTIIAALPYLLIFSGVRPPEWNLDHLSRFDNELATGAYFTGFYEMDTPFFVAAAKLLSEQKDASRHFSTPDAKFAQSMGVSLKAVRDLASVVPLLRRNEAKRKICPSLEREMTRELSSGTLAQAIAATAAPQKASVEPAAHSIPALKKCATCHVSDEYYLGAPRLPFDNEIELRAKLKTSGFKRGTLAQEILYRIHPSTPGREQMPIDPKMLSREAQERQRQEQERVRAYIQSLGR